MATWASVRIRYLSNRQGKTMSNPSDSKRTVAVFGLGYVGCVSAACLAALGHRVVGVDKDEHKVKSVASGRSPFFEPGLDELVRQGAAAGSLTATTSAAEALSDADIALVC